MQIGYPIDKYGMTWKDTQKVDYANEVLADECMNKKASANPKLPHEKPAYKPFPDWTFGYWNSDFTAKYGLGDSLMPQNAGTTKLDESEQLLDQYTSCLSKNPLPVLDHLRLDGKEPPSIIFVAFHEGFNGAMADPRGKKARSQWGACVKNGGDQPSDKALFSLELDPSWSSEQLYKAVTVSATCADQLHIVQNLANLSAGYQDQYIKHHEAQFIEIQKKRDAILKKADQIIASHGG